MAANPYDALGPRSPYADLGPKHPVSESEMYGAPFAAVGAGLASQAAQIAAREGQDPKDPLALHKGVLEHYGKGLLRAGSAVANVSSAVPAAAIGFMSRGPLENVIAAAASPATHAAARATEGAAGLVARGPWATARAIGETAKRAGPEAGKIAMGTVRSFTDPGASFIENPLTTALDWSMAVPTADLAAQGGRKALDLFARKAGAKVGEEIATSVATKGAGEAAKVTKAARATGKPLGTVAESRELGQALSKNVVVQAMKELEESSPAVARYLENKRMTQEAEKILGRPIQSANQAAADEARALEDLDLSQEEWSRLRTMIRFGEPTRVGDSENMLRARIVLEHMNAQDQADFLNMGMFSPEIMQRRALQPLRITMGKGSMASEAQTMRGRSIEAALQEALASGSANVPGRGKVTREEAEMILERRSRKVVEQRYGKTFSSQFRQKYGRWEELEPSVEEMLDELRGLEQAPIYFPTIRKGDTTLDRWNKIAEGVKQRLRPSDAREVPFTKRSRGVTMMSRFEEPDALKALKIHRLWVHRVKRSGMVAEEIVRSPRARLIQSTSELRPDESLVLPDAYLRALKAQEAMQEQVVQGLVDGHSIEGALGKALRDAIMNPEQAKLIAPQTGDRMYAIPTTMARKYRSKFAGDEWYNHPIVKLIVDKPLDYWRMAVLMGRPAWQVNNLVGNTLFSLLSGTHPTAYLKALQSKYRAAMPEEMLGATFVGNEWKAVHPLALDQSHWATKTLKFLDESPVSRGVEKVASGLASMNSKVDDYFRRAAFISEAERLAGKRKLRNAGGELVKGLELLENMDRLSPGMTDEVLRHVNRFFHDYSTLSTFEREGLRRIFPFYGFTRHVARLTFALPREHPLRTRMFAALAQIADEEERYQWRQEGINPDEIRSYRAGAMPLGKTEDGRYRVLSTGGYNPWSSLGMGAPGPSPQGGDVLEEEAGQEKAFKQSVVSQLRPELNYWADRDLTASEAAGRAFPQTLAGQALIRVFQGHADEPLPGAKRDRRTAREILLAFFGFPIRELQESQLVQSERSKNKEQSIARSLKRKEDQRQYEQQQRGVKK